MSSGKFSSITINATDTTVYNYLSFDFRENATIRKNEPGQIKERNGRNLRIDPPGIDCNMDKVKMEFIPIVGKPTKNMLVCKFNNIFFHLYYFPRRSRAFNCNRRNGRKKR